MRRTRPREPREPKLLPPRRKDWKEGTAQVGIFVRTPKGGVLEFCCDEATKEELDAAIAIMAGNHRKEGASSGE